MTRMISRSWSLKFPPLSPPEGEVEAGAGREVGLVEVVQLLFLFTDLSDLQYTVIASHSHLPRDLFRTKCDPSDLSELHPSQEAG